MSVIINYIVKLSSLKLSNDIFNSIWIVVNCYIKMIYFISTTEMIIKYEFVKLYFQEIFKHHSLSKKFVNDWNRLFNNKFIKKLYKETKVIYNLLTSYYLQTDEQTECLNQTLKQYLYIYYKYKQNNWVSLLLIMKFAYNNSVYFTIKVLSFMIHCSYNSKEIRV